MAKARKDEAKLLERQAEKDRKAAEAQKKREEKKRQKEEQKQLAKEKLARENAEQIPEEPGPEGKGRRRGRGPGAGKLQEADVPILREKFPAALSIEITAEVDVFAQRLLADQGKVPTMARLKKGPMKKILKASQAVPQGTLSSHCKHIAGQIADYKDDVAKASAQAHGRKSRLTKTVGGPGDLLAMDLMLRRVLEQADPQCSSLPVILDRGELGLAVILGHSIDALCLTFFCLNQ